MNINVTFEIGPILQGFLNKGPYGDKLDKIQASLDRVETSITNQGASMNAQMQRLKDEVSRNNTVTQSVLTFIQGLRQQILDAAGDPAALQQITDTLQQQDDALAAAIVQNTGAASTEPATGGAQSGSMGTGTVDPSKQ